MDILSQLATSQNRRDEKPNQELAAKIAETENTDAIAELIGLLQSRNKNIQADCIKTLYEIGYLKPELIAPYNKVFLDLLQSKNNRMVWGAMCALDMIAIAKPAEIYEALPLIIETAEKGTVITNDRTVKLLIKLAAHPEYHEAATLFLMEIIERAPVLQLPTYVERTAAVISEDQKTTFIDLVKLRLQEVDYEAKRKTILKAIKSLA